MHFINPIFLWGLLGLSIPIGIHLLSRKEGKIIKLGSLRHLQETSTKQFKGIKLNELVLLSLRCLLIIIFCLLLSGLYLDSAGNKRWVLVEKGLERQNNLLLDSLKTQGYELHWLSKDLPRLTPNDTTGITSDGSYAQAIQCLNKFQVSETIVFAKNNPYKFSGARISLPSTIRWISVVTKPQDYILFAHHLKSDSTAIRKGHSDYLQTNYTDEKTGTRQAHQTNYDQEINVALISDDKYQNDKRIMEAALDVIGATLYYQLNLSESTPAGQLKGDSSQWIIWLSDKVVPREFSRILAINVQPANDLLVQTGPNHWNITKRLTEESALKENLTLRLAELMAVNKDSIQMTASQYDRRMIPDSIAWSGETLKAATTGSFAKTPATPWLLALLFLTLLTERIIAYHRNQ